MIKKQSLYLPLKKITVSQQRILVKITMEYAQL